MLPGARDPCPWHQVMLRDARILRGSRRSRVWPLLPEAGLGEAWLGNGRREAPPTPVCTIHQGWGSGTERGPVWAFSCTRHPASTALWSILASVPHYSHFKGDLAPLTSVLQRTKPFKLQQLPALPCPPIWRAGPQFLPQVVPEPQMLAEESGATCQLLGLPPPTPASRARH